MEDLAEMFDRTHWNTAYFRIDCVGDLAGFWQIKPGGSAVGEMGLGLAPKLTGHGPGTAFVRTGGDFTMAITECRVVELYVAEFNRRAINVYERVGLRAIGSSVCETPQRVVRIHETITRAM